MHIGIFLLLFVVFVVLVAVVVWVVKDSPEELATVNEPDEAEEHLLSDDPDEAIEWLEEFARKQEESKPRRLH